MHPASRFRLRLLRDLARIVLVPSLLLSLIQAIFHIPLRYLSLPAHLAAILLALCLSTFYSNYVQACEARRLGATPIPRVSGKWPGNIDILLRMLSQKQSGYMLDEFLDLFHQHKATTLNLRILWTDKIVTMDREHMKYILSTGFNHFWRGNGQKERLETFLGNGIFNRDDEIWRTHRALARPFFARDRTSDFDVFEKNAQRVLALISDKGRDHVWDAQDLHSRFTLDAASEFLFGKNLDALGYSRDDSSFADAFRDIQQVILDRVSIGSIWPIFELFQDKAMPHAHIIRRWIDPLMHQVLEHKNNTKRTGTAPEHSQSTFLEYLANSTDDMDLIRDQLLNILLASRDTTSSLLTFTTYFMAIHPHVAKKLRAEVLEHIGLDAQPTFGQVKELKYMRAVLMETLRVFHLVPMTSRESKPQSTTLPRPDPTFPLSHDGPLYMPPSTSIIMLPFLMQRNAALWGEDAEVFDPERWIDPTRLKRFLDEPMMFMPFSAGPRICLGQNYALNEASYFFVRLSQQYDSFTLVEERQLSPPWRKTEQSSVSTGTRRKEMEKVWPSHGLSSLIKGGLWIRYGKAMD